MLHLQKEKVLKSSIDFWTKKPRRINVVVDNDSWIIPFAKQLIEDINRQGDEACFVDSYENLKEADISFYLGCIKITPPELLQKAHINLVVHESDLPKGRGFSPVTWQVLEGKNIIPIKLIEMAEEVDAGPIVFESEIVLEGNELIEEIRQKQGKLTIDLCLQYLNSPNYPVGKLQSGEPTFYQRRRPEHSCIDTSKSLDEVFNLLRVVDNEKYPAFFMKNGQKYYIKIHK